MSARIRPADRIYPGYVLDLDGTVYLGGAPLPGAVEAISRLRALGSRFVFLSNNPLWSPSTYAEKLRSMGVPVEDGEVVSSTDALLAYLRDRPPARILAICEPLLTGLLRDAGHVLTDDPADADAVVLSWDRGFTYDKLHAAFIALRGGARLIATNPDPYLPDTRGRPAGLRRAARCRRGGQWRASRGGRRQTVGAHRLGRAGAPRRPARGRGHGRRPAADRRRASPAPRA